jgi:predicted dehydrogenase
MKEMIKAAIIGVTGYGGYLYSLSKKFVEDGKMKWAAAVSLPSVHCPETKEELKTQGCTVYDSTDKMFSEMKDKLDLVLIPTSIGSHCPLTIGALGTNAHVLVEKPAAGTVEEIEKMLAAEEKSPKTVSVGFQDIYRPEVQNAKKKLIAKELGALKSVKVTGIWPRGIDYYTRNHWAGCIKDGNSYIYDSPANNAFAHYLNLALYLAGDKFEESANIKDIKADLYRVWDIESFDTASIKAVSDKGVEIFYSVSHASTTEEHPDIVVECENGKIHLAWEETYTLFSNGKKVNDEEHIGTDGGRRRMYQIAIDRASGKDVFTCSLNIAKAHTKLINDIHKNFEIKTIPAEYWVKVEEGENYFRAVKDINTLIKESNKAGKLLSEMNIDWA